jgi:putative transposase
MVIRKHLKIRNAGLVFVTTTVSNWLPLFKDTETAAVIARQLKETALFHKVSIVGYAIMPSHVHALLGLPDLSELSKFMQGFKSMSSRKIKPILDRNIDEKLMIKGRFCLWKPRYDDIIVYSEEQFRIKLDYIHNNPVKAGLVAEAKDYEPSSARAWLTGKPGIIKIDKGYKWLLQGQG